LKYVLVTIPTKAAEIAGITRSEFIAELTRFKVTPFQYSADEIRQETE
jgi:predicted HTH domain antitoxin